MRLNQILPEQMVSVPKTSKIEPELNELKCIKNHTSCDRIIVRRNNKPGSELVTPNISSKNSLENQWSST